MNAGGEGKRRSGVAHSRCSLQPYSKSGRHRFSKKNFVSIVCIPPHTSHKIQPLDLSFMSPLKTYYSKEIQNWLKHNPSRNIGPFQICKLFCPAYQKCATYEISANGFRKAGIFPLNRNIFSEADFLIERQRERTPPPQEISTTVPPPVPNSSKTTSSIQRSIESTPPKRQTNDGIGTEQMSNVVRVQDFSPLPSCSSVPTSNKGRKAGSAAEITSTPYKNELEAATTEKQRKESLKNKKKLSKPKCRSKTIKKNMKKKKKEEVQEENESSDYSEDPPYDDDSDMDAHEDDDETCIFCSGNFSEDQHGQVWVQCSACFRWAHEDCAGSDKIKAYLCDFCLEK